MKYLGIDHLGIAVHDLETAMATYRDSLGFAILGTESLPERGLDVAFVDAQNSRIELLAPQHEQSEISAFLAKRGEGLHHVCMRVSDIDKAVAKAKAKGLTVVGSGITRGAHGRRVAFIHPKSTHGILLELVEEKEA